MITQTLENGNILVILDHTDDPNLTGPMMIEMTPEQYNSMYGEK